MNDSGFSRTSWGMNPLIPQALSGVSWITNTNEKNHRRFASWYWASPEGGAQQSSTFGRDVAPRQSRRSARSLLRKRIAKQRGS